jgi:DHA2 family multidrug resistance protein
MQGAMVLRGSAPSTAEGQAYGALWGTVQRQASMLAFVDTFRAMAIVFLLVVPFLFIMRRPTHTRSAGPMH